MFGTSHDRAIELAEYVINNKSTVREAAKVFGISKSTVHTDITEKLRHISPALYSDVRAVLDLNKAQRHIRGGEATRRKYKNP